MANEYYFTKPDIEWALRWVEEIDRLIPRDSPQNDYLEEKYGMFLKFLDYIAHPDTFKLAQKIEGSYKLINRMANWSQIVDENDGMLFVYEDVNSTLERILEDVLSFNSRPNKYTIKTLDPINEYKPQLLNYNSLGVFKDKHVFHANIQNLLKHWSINEQGFIPQFNEKYDENQFNNPGFRRELYGLASNVSIGLPMPRVSYSKKINSIQFENGRHRARFIEYLGARDIYILIPDNEEQKNWFRYNCKFLK